MALTPEELKRKKNKGIGMAAGAATGLLDNVFKDDINEDFKKRNAKLFSFDDGANKTRQGLEGAAFSTGNPAAMILGGVSAIGRQVDKATKDEFGIYKSGGAQILDRVLDPIGNIQDIFGGTSQKDLKNKKKVFEFDNNAGAIDKNNRLGAMIKNSTPGFIAPAYGRRGMKFKTKFNY